MCWSLFSVANVFVILREIILRFVTAFKEEGALECGLICTFRQRHRFPGSQGFSTNVGFVVFGYQLCWQICKYSLCRPNNRLLCVFICTENVDNGRRVSSLCARHKQLQWSNVDVKIKNWYETIKLFSLPWHSLTVAGGGGNLPIMFQVFRTFFTSLYSRVFNWNYALVCFAFTQKHRFIVYTCR